MAATMVMTLLIGVASAAYQGGGDQTYHTDDEHLGHGGPGGSGSTGVSHTGIIVLICLFFAVIAAGALAAWRSYSDEKPEEKPELEMTVGADLEEGVELQEGKSSQKRTSGTSTAPSDTPLVEQMA